MASTTPSLRLVDFSDRELLFIVDDCLDSTGWTTVADVAKALDLDTPNPTLNVSSRFSWLKRYGALDREGKKWQLTPVGRALMSGQLNVTAERVLDGVKPDQLLALTRAIGRRYQQAGDTAATLMRREWVYSSAQRSR